MVLYAWLQKYSAIDICKHSRLNMKYHPIIPNNPLIDFSIIGHNDMPPRIPSFWYHSTISPNTLFSRTSRRYPHTEVFWILKEWKSNRMLIWRASWLRRQEEWWPSLLRLFWRIWRRTAWLHRRPAAIPGWPPGRQAEEGPWPGAGLWIFQNTEGRMPNSSWGRREWS